MLRNSAGEVYSVGEFEVSELMGQVEVWLVVVDGVGIYDYGGFYTKDEAEVAMMEVYNESLTALDAMEEVCCQKE